MQTSFSFYTQTHDATDVPKHNFSGIKKNANATTDTLAQTIWDPPDLIRINQLAIMNTWLQALGDKKRQRVLQKHPPKQETMQQKKQREYEQQRDVWAREGVFYNKVSATWESRSVQADGSLVHRPVSGEWYYNKPKDILELYSDIKSAPVASKDAVCKK
jgi:hypothetical protein